MLLSVLFARSDCSTSPVINDVGILEILWLSEHDPSMRSNFRSVEVPTKENLRAAGMVQIYRPEADATDLGEHGQPFDISEYL